MFWIKSQSGGLVNLAVATDVKITPHSDPQIADKQEVKAFFVSGGDTADYTTLFVGTKDECEKYLSDIWTVLRAESEAN